MKVDIEPKWMCNRGGLNNGEPLHLTSVNNVTHYQHLRIVAGILKRENYDCSRKSIYTQCKGQL